MKTARFIRISLGGALLGVLAACQPDNLLPSQPQGDATVITFHSPYTVDTRSAAMRNGSFKQGDKVGVLGFCKATNNGNDVSTSPWDTKKPFCTPDVFYNQPLTYNGTGAWTYEWAGDFDGKGPVGDLHPWSQNPDDTFSFFAYYPYADLSNGGKIHIDGWEEHEENGLGIIKLSEGNHRGDPTITYTMPHSLGSSYTSACQWWVVPDFMLAYTTDHKKSDGSVRLEFRHLFCAFAFEINNYNTEPVTLETLYIGGGNDNRSSGFYRSVTVTGQESGYSVDKNDIYIGRFQLVGSDGGNEHILQSFACPAAETDADGEVIAPSTVSIDYNNEPIDLLFIPDQDGKLTADGNQSLYIRLQLKTESGTQIGDGDNRVMNLGNQSFLPGTRSIFSINVIGNDFYVQMRSDGQWDDGGDSDIVFE